MSISIPPTERFPYNFSGLSDATRLASPVPNWSALAASRLGTLSARPAEAPTMMSAERQLRSEIIPGVRRYGIHVDSSGKPSPQHMDTVPGDDDFVWLVIGADQFASVAPTLNQALGEGLGPIPNKLSALHDAADHGGHGFACLPFMKRVQSSSGEDFEFRVGTTASHFYLLPSSRTLVTVTYGFEFSERFFPKAQQFLHASGEPCSMLMYGHLLEMSTSTRDLLNDLSVFLGDFRGRLKAFESRARDIKFGATDAPPTTLIEELAELGGSLARCKLTLVEMQTHVFHQGQLVNRLSSPAKGSGDFLGMLDESPVSARSLKKGVGKQLCQWLKDLYSDNFGVNLGTLVDIVRALEEYHAQLESNLRIRQQAQAAEIEQRQNDLDQVRSRINNYWGFAATGFFGCIGILQVTMNSQTLNKSWFNLTVSGIGVALGLFNVWRIFREERKTPR